MISNFKRRHSNCPEQFKLLQAVYRSITHFRMAQCRETILKMVEWSTNSTAIRGSVLTALMLFSVIKDSGMVLNQAVSQKVSVLSRA